MTRRVLLSLPLAATCLRASSSQEVWDLLASMATALSERYPDAFMEAFERSSPGFAELRATIVALLNQADLESAVEFTRNDGDDRGRTVEADWVLKITDRESAARTTRREKHITCRLVKTGRKWHITAFEPLDLFALPW